jgi:hypothetical protein
LYPDWKEGEERGAGLLLTLYQKAKKEERKEEIRNKRLK